jgi:hypothetical protein
METKIQITAPMHVSCAGFASGVATALKAIRGRTETASPQDIERDVELLLAKANHNLNFNNAIVAHQHGFDARNVRMRCRIDKESHILYLHVSGAKDEAGKDNS